MSNGPRDDDAEYGWLYGRRRGRADDEATRRLPVQPRPDAPSRPQPPPRQPQPVPPQAPPPARGRRRTWRPRSWVRLVLALLVLWLVYLVAVPFFAWSKVDKVEFAPTGDRPDDQPGTTYLLVGSDSRGDLTAKQRRRLGTGNAAGQRTDTIMVLHTGSGPNLLMSIPRDSIVSIPGHGDGLKINAAFAYGGAQLLTETIEQETGIRVDHYVEIGFGGFVDLVDAVGGVEICPKQAIDDKQAKLKIDKGCQEVDGPQALGYARSRKTYAQGDLQRAQAQREVVSAIGRKVLSPWSVLNPFRYWDLNMAATKAVAVGEGMSPVRAAMWASAMTNVDGEKGLTCGVPIADLSVRWDEERAARMFEAIITDDTDSIDAELCTPTGLKKQ